MPRSPITPARAARHAAPPPPVSVRLERSLGIFLGMNRTGLAMFSIAACGALAAIPALPAEADMIQVDVQIAAAQTFTAPAAAAATTLPSLDRDAWSVSVFSLVQRPMPDGTTQSSGYGYRSCAGCSSFHEGIDLNPGNGYPVVAVANGTVITSEFSGALGAHVIIEHVIDGQVVRTIYGHMQGDSLAVSVGQQVSIGQQLGLVGSTGQSTGPHLHFAVEIDGTLIDPDPWLDAKVNTVYGAN